MKAVRLCLAWTALVFVCGTALAREASPTAGLGVVPPGPPECGAAAPLVFSNSAPVALADNAVVTSAVLVSGAGPYLWDVGVLTNLVHSFNGEISMTLTSPAGTIVTLTSNNGGSNADVFNGTVWDDQANPGGQVPYTSNNGLATDHLYVSGVTATPLAPEEPLGAFVGEDPNGTWTLAIADNAPGHTGTLNGWSLAIAALPNAPSVFSRLSPSNSNPVPIASGATATSTIVVPPGVGSRICKLTLEAGITHPSCGHLEVTLKSPAASIATLTTGNGGANANVFQGTLWADDANPGGLLPYSSNAGLATDQVYVNGVAAATLAPEEPLALFNGQNPSGTWTLTVSDDGSGAAGSLDGWRLDVTTCSCAQTLPAAPLRVDEHGGGTSDLNGVFEAGETVDVEPSWANAGSTIFTVVTQAQNFVGPAGPAYEFVDRGASYGVIPPLATSNCHDATGDCYRLRITGARPAAHWDASFDEISVPIDAPGVQPYFSTWVLHVGDSFADVPRSNQFYRHIETIFHNGVTGGGSCGGFCPQAWALRQQMAVFLLKAKEGAAYVPPPATGVFADVPASDPFAPWIEELYRRGIAAGCNPGNYCPTAAVLRRQMSVFLLKMLLGSSYVPPAATGIFSDVPKTNSFAPWVEDLYHRGIAAGCGSGKFCPSSPNTRGQMAVFLTKTFGLLLYGP